MIDRRIVRSGGRHPARDLNISGLWNLVCDLGFPVPLSDKKSDPAECTYRPLMIVSNPKTLAWSDRTSTYRISLCGVASHLHIRTMGPWDLEQHSAGIESHWQKFHLWEPAVGQGTSNDQESTHDPTSSGTFSSSLPSVSKVILPLISVAIALNRG